MNARLHDYTIKIVVEERGSTTAETFLREAGLEGWRLISAHHEDGTGVAIMGLRYWTFVFERAYPDRPHMVSMLDDRVVPTGSQMPDEAPGGEEVKRLRELINGQANDDALWIMGRVGRRSENFDGTAVEEYLQRALRTLHMAAERLLDRLEAEGR